MCPTQVVAIDFERNTAVRDSNTKAWVLEQIDSVDTILVN